MRHKRLKLSTVLLLGLGLTGLQAQTMYVKEKSESQTAYLLSNIQKMSFSSGNITISKTGGNSDDYALSGLRYLNFIDLTGTIPIASESEGTEVQVYPNPVIDILNIRLTKSEKQTGVIEILSIDGKLVYAQKINSYSNVYQVNTISLPKGLYLCKINNGTTIEFVKLIKQ